MPTIWKPIPYLTTYEVSDTGQVRLEERVLRQTPNEQGYLRVRLVHPGGLRRWHRVSVLVLEAFVGPRPSSRHVAAHAPDRRKSNNRLTNLRWALPEENERDKRAHGTHPRGGRVPFVSRARLKIIQHLLEQGLSYTQIAREVGLHRHSISRIARGQRRAAERAVAA